MKRKTSLKLKEGRVSPSPARRANTTTTSLESMAGEQENFKEEKGSGGDSGDQINLKIKDQVNLQPGRDLPTLGRELSNGTSVRRTGAKCTSR